MEYATLFAADPEDEMIGNKRVGDLKMCSCAKCGQEMLAWSESGWFDHQRASVKDRFPMTFVTIQNRPYCERCRNSRR